MQNPHCLLGLVKFNFSVEPVENLCLFGLSSITSDAKRKLEGEPMKPLHQAKQIGDSFFSYFSQHCSILCACRTALLPILKITKQLKLSNLYTYDTVLFKLQLFSTANAFIVYMIGLVKPF